MLTDFNDIWYMYVCMYVCIYSSARKQHTKHHARRTARPKGAYSCRNKNVSINILATTYNITYNLTQ